MMHEYVVHHHLMNLCNNRTLYSRRAKYHPALPQSKLAIKDAMTSNPSWRYNYHGFRLRQFELNKKHQVDAERFNYKSEEKLDEDVGVNSRLLIS